MKTQKSSVKEKNPSCYSPQKQVRQNGVHPQANNKIFKSLKGHSQTYIEGNKMVKFQKKIPERIIEDRESLYDSNIKLKEKIKDLEKENIKLKTKAHVSEKQKQQIIGIYQNFSENPTQSKYKQYFTSKSSFKNKHLAKKMFRQTKDQLQSLKLQNMRLIKSTKSTQLAEMKVQNERLIQQNLRLKEYLKFYIHNENETEVLQDQRQKYQKEINWLKNELQRKKKENQGLKDKIFMNKKQIVPEKDKSFRKKIKKQPFIPQEAQHHTNHIRRASKLQKTVPIQTYKCLKCQKLDQNIQELKKKIKEKQQKLVQVQKEKRQIEREMEKMKEAEKQKDILDCSIESSAQRLKVNKGDDELEIKKVVSKQIESNDILNLDEKEFEQTQKQIHSQRIQSQLNNLIDQNSEQNLENESVQVSKVQNLGNQSQKELFKNITLKQTIKYKLIAQRYTFSAFQKDIRQSKIKQFSKAQFTSIISTQPFFLGDDDVDTMINEIFQSPQINSIPSDRLLQRIKNFIQDFQLLSEEEETQLLKEITQEINKEVKVLVKAFKKVQSSEEVVSKQDFAQVLYYIGKMNDKMIQICLGEACLMSSDINHLNYKNFLRRFIQDQSNI